MRRSKFKDGQYQPSDIEIRILEKACDGETFLRIGMQTGHTRATIGKYSQRLYDRIGADNLAQAIAIAFRRGWIK